MIGGGGISGEESGDRREAIGGEGILGKKSDWEWGKRGGEMGFREKDGEFELGVSRASGWEGR